MAVSKNIAYSRYLQGKADQKVMKPSEARKAKAMASVFEFCAKANKKTHTDNLKAITDKWPKVIQFFNNNRTRIERAVEMAGKYDSMSDSDKRKHHAECKGIFNKFRKVSEIFRYPTAAAANKMVVNREDAESIANLINKMKAEGGWSGEGDHIDRQDKKSRRQAWVKTMEEIMTCINAGVPPTCWPKREQGVDGTNTAGRMVHAYLVKDDKSGLFDEDKEKTLKNLIIKCRNMAEVDEDENRMYWAKEEWSHWGDALEEALSSAGSQQAGFQYDSSSNWKAQEANIDRVFHALWILYKAFRDETGMNEVVTTKFTVALVKSFFAKYGMMFQRTIGQSRITLILKNCGIHTLRRVPDQLADKKEEKYESPLMIDMKRFNIGMSCFCNAPSAAQVMMQLGGTQNAGAIISYIFALD